MTPIKNMNRTATRDTELRGQKIREGEKVLLLYESANRDERVFAEPDRFDVARTPNDHVAFGGYGAHFCLGASLARLELRVMFEELLRAAARARARRRRRRRRCARRTSSSASSTCRSRSSAPRSDAMPNLTGKVAFVTAGATGIGFACAQAIAEAGGKVMICARREDTLRDAAAKLGPNAAWVACDVTDDASVDAAIAATRPALRRPFARGELRGHRHCRSARCRPRPPSSSACSTPTSSARSAACAPRRAR